MNQGRPPEDSAFGTYLAHASPASLARLLEAIRSSVFNWCYQVLEQRQDAEDVSQKVLLEAATHAGDFTNAAAFRGWIFRVCLAKSLNHRRGRARRVAHETRKAGANGHTNGHRSEWGDRESRLALLQAIEELPDEDRSLVLERYFDGDALHVMAGRRGCSKVAIWNRLRRIRARLRRRLEKAGLGAAILDMGFWLGALRFPARPDSTRAAPVATSASGAHAKLWTAASIVAAVLVGAGFLGVLKPARVVRKEVAAVAGRLTPNSRASSRERAAGEASTVKRVEPAAPATPAARDQDHVRWLYQKMLIQIRTGTRVIWESSTELERFADRIKKAHRDPELHATEMARFMGLLYRVGAEESGFPVSGEGLRRMDRLEMDLESSLRNLPPEAGAARLQAAVEADLAFARGMAEILPRDGAGSMMFCVIDRILKRGSSKSMPRDYIQKEIVTDWAAATPGDAALHPRLERAAEELASQLDRITREFETRPEKEPFDDVEFVWSFLRSSSVQPYDPIRRMEYQVECLKAARRALEPVRQEVEPSTWSRFAQAEPWTYAVSRPGTKGLVDRRD